MLFKKKIGIDLGTDTTQIYLKGAGIIVNEPSIIAFNNRTNRIIAIGTEAKKMLSRTPVHITALHPITNGVIADFDMAKEMIERFLKNEKIPWSWTTHAVVSVPTNLTEVERKSVEDLLQEVGSNRVDLVEQPIVAAFGSRLDIHQPKAYLIVDIGAGSTDMAVISMNGIVASRRLKIAGNHLNKEILRAMREELKIDIGDPTAEEVKIGVGSAVPQTDRLEISVQGRDVTSGLPKEIVIRDTQVRFWIGQSLRKLIDSLKDLIENTPAELVGDIYKNGIYFCGGGSLLRGVHQLFEKEIGVPIRIVDEPLTCVARGTGLITERYNDFTHLLNTFSSIRMSPN